MFSSSSEFSGKSFIGAISPIQFFSDDLYFSINIKSLMQDLQSNDNRRYSSDDLKN